MATSNDTNLELNAPVSLLPDLEQWGIEEVDKGTCLDSAENRLIIRQMKSRYQPVYDSEGKLTPYIQVITPEMRQAAMANKAILLTDTRNNDSDYVTGLKLIVEPAADHLVPAWVLASTRHWLDVAEKRKKDNNPQYRPALLGPPSRCAAKKIDGHRCNNWTNGTVDYGNFCRVHLSNRQYGEEEGAGHVAKARNRIQSAALGAADVLEDLMYSATSEVVRKAAADSLLDRAGVRGGVEIDSAVTVTVNHAETVRERLKLLREGAIAKAALEARMSGHSTDDENEEVAVIVDADGKEVVSE
jgi:hypothetical protein